MVGRVAGRNFANFAISLDYRDQCSLMTMVMIMSRVVFCLVIGRVAGYRDGIPAKFASFLARLLQPMQLDNDDDDNNDMCCPLSVSRLLGGRFEEKICVLSSICLLCLDRIRMLLWDFSALDKRRGGQRT